MLRSSVLTGRYRARPWLRLALVMLLPALWLLAGLAFLSPLR